MPPFSYESTKQSLHSILYTVRSLATSSATISNLPRGPYPPPGHHPIHIRSNNESSQIRPLAKNLPQSQKFPTGHRSFVEAQRLPSTGPCPFSVLSLSLTSVSRSTAATFRVPLSGGRPCWVKVVCSRHIE